MVCLSAGGGQDHLERNLVDARNLRAARGTPCEPTNRSETGTAAGGAKLGKGKAVVSSLVVGGGENWLIPLSLKKGE